MEKQLSVTELAAMLIAVARAAYDVADSSIEDHMGQGVVVYRYDPETMQVLSNALDKLDELPEPGHFEFGTGPAKAEVLINRSLEELEAKKISKQLITF